MQQKSVSVCCMCFLKYSQHDLLFGLFQEQESHWACKHQVYGCKSRGLVMKSRLHTNVTVIVIFHSTILMVNRHVNRILKSVQK